MQPTPPLVPDVSFQRLIQIENEADHLPPLRMRKLEFHTTYKMSLHHVWHKNCFAMHLK
jgi:hypothetical protein